MGNKIYVEINEREQPLWLSPAVGEERIKILQNISVTIGITTEANLAAAVENGPGEVPSVILRNFTSVVSEGDFRNAEFCPPSDENWSYAWKNGKDLAFTYTDGEPFADGTKQYRFEWFNFYTLVTPEREKRVEYPVEAYDIPGCGSGAQGSYVARFAVPAYIISLEPDMKTTSGIVKSDLENHIYTVSQGSPFTLKWTGAADFTDEVMLRKNAVKIGGTFLINGSYSNGKVVDDAAYELTVTNSYRFSHIRSLQIEKTNWEKAGQEKGIFKEDIYGNRNYNLRIFADNGNYYAYLHPTLYKRDANGEWRTAATNTLYQNADYSCFAAYYSGGKLEVAGNSKGSAYYSFCRYQLQSGTWENVEGSVNLPKYSDTEPMCCGFAASLQETYFYRRSGACLYMNRYENGLGWGGGQFFFNAPSGMRLISGTLGFYVSQFYTAMLCQETAGGGDKYVYLYDCNDKSQKHIMKKQVANTSRTVTMLETDNYLCLVTENELIKYEQKTVENRFFPMVAEGRRAWLGGDGEKIIGIFPDKHMWKYHD